MAKKTRTRPAAASRPTADEVGPRQPCPCGSGRRYKSCHGREGGAPAPYVARTFQGLAGECDLVAMREIVPAATAPLTLASGVADGVGKGREVTVCSLLPGALPALVRADGAVWLGLQVHHNHGDVSRDLAYALELALAAEPGAQVDVVDTPPPGPRLQDLVDTAAALPVTVHEDFGFWVADVEDPDGSLAGALQAANDAAAPSVRLAAVEACYWTRMGGREYVRWVLPHDEGRLLDAIARLHAAHGDALLDPDATGVQAGRLIGMFRAHGLLVPVWEVPDGTGAGLDEPFAALSGRLDEALASTAPLSAGERSARSGLANRQLTIR